MEVSNGVVGERRKSGKVEKEVVTLEIKDRDEVR